MKPASQKDVIIINQRTLLWVLIFIGMAGFALGVLFKAIDSLYWGC